jgi:hypothetical protein
VSRPSVASRMGEETGAVAGWEALPFGLLVFAVGTLVIANAWAVVDAKMATAAAAREGARALVEAVDESAGIIDAEDAVARTLEGHGRDSGSATVSLAGSFERCAQVAVTVEVPVPSVAVPWVGGLGADLVARSTHAELVDPLRSGVPGEASCVTS